MAMCFKTEYDENGKDIWEGFKSTAKPEGNKPPPDSATDKKVQAILKKIGFKKDS